MKIAAHLEKLRRFESVRERMHPIEDFEMWYWMGLSGGTTIINAALHAAGLTDEDQHFATQIPDVYSTSNGSGGWENRIVLRNDLIHVGLPPLESELPTDLAKAFAAMEIIERYRDPCVRSNHQISQALVSECDAAYRECIAACRDSMSRNRR